MTTTCGGIGARMLRIALGGALGTGLRLSVGGLVVLSAAPPGPLRLLALNLAGATALGWVSVRRPVAAAWMPALTTGLLGGLTTFSTMIVQAGSLGHDAGLVVEGSGRMTGAGLGLVAAYLTASVTLGLAGLILGRRLGARSSSHGRTVAP
jgi:fluoride exporter